MIETDVIVIGAGPCGLFTVFEAGLLKWKCHLIDYLPIPGGQCSEIYPKKPIYDIPGFPSVLAGELVDNLLKQGAPFHPGFTLGERAEQLEKLEDGTFRLTTSRGTVITGKTVFLAGGLGCFEPRKPVISNIVDFEDKGVEYIIKDPEFYRGKRVIIGGGGDSALDWTIVLADIASDVTMVHRSAQFRAAPDSVSKAHELATSGRITLITDAQVTELHGEGALQSVTITHNNDEKRDITVDHFIPLFGLSPKLGPIATWGLSLDKNSVNVDPVTFQTSIEGIYAVGDIAEYPNKLKLILCGFHEAAMALNFEYQRLHPEKKHVLKYTTVTGVGTL
ncbi:MAG: NAD(P)/FAD-dependent oxidoreductase [Candidatus Kapabacteria bacterium]|nr:NAD(P)/FAD-dependent oxidoreductase [Candidatus Kapabacteria bacterium]